MVAGEDDGVAAGLDGEGQRLHSVCRAAGVEELDGGGVLAGREFGSGEAEVAGEVLPAARVGGWVGRAGDELAGEAEEQQARADFVARVSAALLCGGEHCTADDGGIAD